jgi:integrase/recombinase XerC
MTTALSLIGLPAGRDYDKIATKEEPVINEAMIKKFIAYLDVSKTTLNKYEYCLNVFLGWMKSKGIVSPLRNDILRYKAEMESVYKPATIALILAAVKLFFRFLAGEGLYQNIADHIKTPMKSRGYKKDYLTSDQIKSILSKIDKQTLIGKRDYALLLLALTDGLRTVEISRADVADLRINGNSEVLYVQGKGRLEKDEFVKISPEVSEAIREYLMSRDNGNSVENNEGRPLFESYSDRSAGQRITIRCIRWIIKERMRSAGFNSERLTAHSLRHTAITLSLLAGASLQEVQQFARHSSIDTTQIYAHNLECLDNPCNVKITEAIFN